MHRRPGIVLALGLLAAACGGVTPASPGAPTPPTSPGSPAAGDPSLPPELAFLAQLPEATSDERPPADSAYAREAEALDGDGIPSKAQALRLFALAFGPVPGVEVQPDGMPIRSATLALRVIRAYWDELSDEQRAAIEAATAVPEDAPSVEVGPVSGAAVPRGVALAGFAGAADRGRIRPAEALPTDQVLEGIRSAVAWARAAISAKSGDDIPGRIKVRLAACGEAWACAEGAYGSAPPGTISGPGTYQGCRVTVTSDGLAAGPMFFLKIIAHEVFHCFQFHGLGTVDRQAVAPDWVIEGGASWAANDVTSSLPIVDEAFDGWFQDPASSLFTRSYNAAGFWAALEQSGKSPYDVFPSVWQAGGSSAMFRATGAPENDKLLDLWASSLTHLAAWGRDWDLVGPGIAPVVAPVETWPVGNDSSTEIHANAYTARLFALDISADIVAIAGTGHARIGDGRIDSTIFPARFCASPDGCPPCPDSDDIPPPPIGRSPVFALTGGVGGSTFTIRGLAKEACETPSPPPSEPAEDEFCKRYKAMVEWGQTAGEMSRPVAREIVRRAQDMRPYAPADMVPWVDVLIEAYGIYGTAEEPFNVPMAGPAAAKLGDAFMALHAHCGLPFQ